MKYLVAFLSVATLAACAVNPPQLGKDIFAGLTPKVSVIVSAPNQIEVEYIGTTVFNNGGKNYRLKSNLENSIADYLETSLINSQAIQYVPLTNKSRRMFKNGLRKPFFRIQNAHLDEQALEAISEWEHTSNIDYLIVILPDYSGSPIYNRVGSIRGSGLLVDSFQGHLSFTVGAYKAIVVDTKQFTVIGESSSIQFKQIRSYRYDELSPEQLQAVKTQLEADSSNYEEDGRGIKPLSLEKRLAIAKLYKSDELENLSNEEIEDIEKRSLFVTKIAAEQALASIGVIIGNPNHTQYGRMRATEQVERLYFAN